MIYYTYLITNTKQNKYYIGSRQCEVDPIKDIGVKYFSSSTDKDFIQDQKQNPDDYKYRVLMLFTSREDAFLCEMELHETYKASSNPSFYNRANCTSTGFNTSGTVPVKDKDGNTMRVPLDDPRYKSGELVHNTSGTVTVKDKDGNTMQVPIDDPRFLSGELNHIWDGKHHSDETKAKIGKANSIRQSGSGNSQYGKMWITNPEEKKNTRIKKTDPIPDGWSKGRKMDY